MSEPSGKQRSEGADSSVPAEKTKVQNDAPMPISTEHDDPEVRATENPPADEELPVDEEIPAAVTESEKKKGKRRIDEALEDASSAPAVKYRKLAPPRPFPTVPTSVSATGPRSAHVEGKNYICVTRKTPLAMYLRRCKDVVLKDG